MVARFGPDENGNYGYDPYAEEWDENSASEFWANSDSICPLDCDYPDSDHEFCKAVAERLDKYSQPTEKEEPVVDFDFLEKFEKKWKFWKYLNPYTMEGDTAPDEELEVIPVQLPLFTIKHGWVNI